MADKPKGQQFDPAKVNKSKRLEVEQVQPTLPPEPEQPEAIEEQPEAATLTELQAAYQQAVLDTQVSPDTVRATYEAHMGVFNEQLRYTKSKCKEGSEKWSKYFKLRGLSQHVPAKVTQLLALLKYPELFTEYWVQVDDQQGARVWAYVYASPADFSWLAGPDGAPMLDGNGSLIPGGKYLARDVKQVRAKSGGPREDNGGGGDYLEKAITGARQRALKQLGLGTAAGIAALEDVQDAERGQHSGAITPPKPQRPPVAQQPEPQPVETENEPEEREAMHSQGTVGQEGEQFRQWQEARQQRAEAAREKFLEYLGTRSKVLTRDEVEAVYGPVADMTVEDMKRVHGELERFRSRAKWQEHMNKATAPEYWKQWRDWPGSSPQEQAQLYFQTIHDALDDDQTELRESMVSAVAAAAGVSDDLQLLPAEQQLDALAQGLLPALDGVLDLDEVRP